VTEERPTESIPTPAYSPPSSPPAAEADEPAISWAPPPPPAAARATAGPRTGMALAAGILLVVLGALGVVIGIATLTVGRELISQIDFSGIPGAEGIDDPKAVAESVLAFFGILLLVCSTFYVVGGVGAIRSKNWGRVTGIVIGVLGGLFWLAGLANGNPRGFAGLAVLLAIHVYIAVALLFFWRTKATA